MDWLGDLNRAMGYIEEHLRDGDIDMDEVARQAACSTFQLQRMFPYLTGIALSEYIRRRKMSAAAEDLATTDVKVIDLAQRYGYESPTAFNRAFKGVHGLAPSHARRKDAPVVTYPRLVFTLSIKGEEAMKYEICEKKAFRVVGYATHEECTMENAGEKAEEMWAKVEGEGLIPQIAALIDGSGPVGLLGVSICDDGGNRGQMVGAATALPCPEGLEEYDIPAATYAVFKTRGPIPEAIQQLEHRIYSEWLPSSGYDWAPTPDFEVYGQMDEGARECDIEVWLPVRKKSS